MRQKTAYGNIMLFALMMIAGIMIGGEWEWLIVLAAAILHEGGHYLASCLCGVKVSGFRLNLLGARMQLAGLLSYKKEFLIAAGGPAVNLLCAGALYLVSQTVALTEAWSLFGYASVGLGLLNLLPVRTLDGGRMLTAGISFFISQEAARKCIGVTTAFCLGILWMLTVYGLLRGAPVVSLSVFFWLLLLRNSLPSTRYGNME